MTTTASPAHTETPNHWLCSTLCPLKTSILSQFKQQQLRTFASLPCWPSPSFSRSSTQPRTGNQSTSAFPDIASFHLRQSKYWWNSSFIRDIGHCRQEGYCADEQSHCLQMVTWRQNIQPCSESCWSSSRFVDHKEPRGRGTVLVAKLDCWNDKRKSDSLTMHNIWSRVYAPGTGNQWPQITVRKKQLVPKREQDCHHVEEEHTGLN